MLEAIPAQNWNKIRIQNCIFNENFRLFLALAFDDECSIPFVIEQGKFTRPATCFAILTIFLIGPLRRVKKNVICFCAMGALVGSRVCFWLVSFHGIEIQFWKRPCYLTKAIASYKKHFRRFSEIRMCLLHVLKIRHLANFYLCLCIPVE
jgi:hypothetical protein